MRSRIAALAVLCLGLNACTSQAPAMPTPVGVMGPAQPAKVGPVGRAEAIDDFIVVRKAGGVSVLRRLDAKPLWVVPQRPDDPITKARLAQGSIVVVRRSQTAEVYDLATGQLRFAKQAASAVGVSWTALFADSSACQPDCLLRGYDLETGRELWTGPNLLPGKVMVEPGDSPDGKYSPPGQFDGPLRAPETSVIAVRGSDGVMFLDAGTGQELSRVPAPEAGLALGSKDVLVEWAPAETCTVRVVGRSAATGEVAWQLMAGTGLPDQPSVCFTGWRPEITDGLLVVNDAQGHAKVIEVDAGTVRYGVNPFGDPAVAVSRRAVFTLGAAQLAAFRPDAEVWATRLWAAELSETSKVAGIVLDFDRLLYTTQYEGSPRGIGWVRDATTGKRLWVRDGMIPLGVDGDRVIAEAPNGEIRLERVSTG